MKISLTVPQYLLFPGMATIVRNNEDPETGQTSERKSLSSQEFQSTKHALPPTRLSHTILHENASQERQLNIQVAAIKARQNMMSSKLESSRRYFMDSQTRKERKWKREDEMRATSMNFPHLPASKSDNGGRPNSMTVLYSSPHYQRCENDNEMVKSLRGGGSLLPYMSLRRERTEILQHGGNVFYMTRLPSIIQVDSNKYEDYTKYCGAGVDKLGVPLKDSRFNDLHKLLAPNGGYVDGRDASRVADATKGEGSREKIALSLPSLMTGGVTLQCPSVQIKREFEMHKTKKELRRQTNWKKLKTIVSACAKFKNEDSQLFRRTAKGKLIRKSQKTSAALK